MTNEMDDTERCENCAAFHKGTSDSDEQGTPLWGTCRRWAPRPAVVPPGVDGPDWPMVDASDWCLEWVDRHTLKPLLEE